MQRKASALPFLLALAIACAHGEALFTDPIATNSANAPLIWLNRETTAATTLTLTREPDGGDTIAVIPRGGSITVLMRDADGHTLAKTPFGITGWGGGGGGGGRGGGGGGGGGGGLSLSSVPGWPPCSGPAAGRPTPRGSGSTDRGLCVLHEDPTHPEYPRPSFSSTPPSCSACTASERPRP